MRKLYYIFFLVSLLANAQEKFSYSFYFNNASSEVSPKNVRLIDSIKSVHTGDSLVLRFQGYANEIGKTDYNKQLSFKRVTALASYFDASTILDSEAMGEIEGDETYNRRVDLQLKVFKAKEKDYQDLSVGDKFVLRGIHFQGGYDYLTYGSQSALIELFEFLRDNRSVHIHITGHICCHDDDPSKDGLNLSSRRNTLSADRAKVIYNYLVANGISEKRLSHEGRAYLEPLGGADHLDRRVEIEILNGASRDAFKDLEFKKESFYDLVGNMKAQQRQIINEIRFKEGTAFFDQTSYNALLSLSDQLIDTPTFSINIRVYSKRDGFLNRTYKDALNNVSGTYTLSSDRAEAIYLHLITQGVAENQLQYKGMGFLSFTSENAATDCRVEIEKN